MDMFKISKQDNAVKDAPSPSSVRAGGDPRATLLTNKIRSQKERIGSHRNDPSDTGCVQDLSSRPHCRLHSAVSSSGSACCFVAPTTTAASHQDKRHSSNQRMPTACHPCVHDFRPLSQCGRTALAAQSRDRCVERQLLGRRLDRPLLSGRVCRLPFAAFRTIAAAPAAMSSTLAANERLRGW
jgi:hypothetical protein